MPLFDRIRRDVSLQVNARADDFVRMTKLLTSYQGAKFLANQALLRASNFDTTKGERKQSAIDSVIDISSVTASLLSQVAVNGTGTHFLINELGAQMNKTPYFTGNGQAATQAKYGGRVSVTRAGSKELTSVQMPSAQSMEAMVYNDDFHSYIKSKSPNTGPDLEGVFLENGMTTDSNLYEVLHKDTLPVVFGVVDNSHSSLPFRGFVQNINDSFSANWNSINYVGRNEPLYIYDNTTRTLGFTLQIPIFSSKDTRRIYQRVNALMSYMYGRYGNSKPVDENSLQPNGSVNGLNQGTVLSIRVGDYFKGFGIMTSLSHQIALEVPWSSTGDYQKKNNRLATGERDLILPQVITLSLSFNIIHEKLPQRTVGQEETSYLPFVGVGDISVATGEVEE